MNRQSRGRLLVADQLFAALTGLNCLSPEATNDVRRLRSTAWQSLLLWDEHTWGADISVRHPESEDTYSQWHHKAYYAYHARSLSLLLQRDGITELAKQIPRQEGDALIAFNPLPWRRVVAAAVPPQVLRLRGTPDDPTASRHSQDREFVGTRRWWLPPSGYYLGLQAMVAAVRAADGRSPQMHLLPLVMESLGLRDINELMRRLYYEGMSRAAIAALGPSLARHHSPRRHSRTWQSARQQTLAAGL